MQGHTWQNWQKYFIAPVPGNVTYVNSKIRSLVYIYLLKFKIQLHVASYPGMLNRIELQEIIS